MRAERRDRAVHDALGQREHLGGVRAVPRFDGRAAGDGMQHPLGLFTQGVASAIGELGRQLHDHILYIVHRHVRGHGAHDNSRAAEVLGLDAGIGQKVKVLQNGLFFRGGQIDLHRDEQHLGRHAAVVPGQLLKQNALMRSVLVDKAKLTAALGDDIGLEHLADKAQRLACRRRGQRRLLGTCADHVGQGA